MRLVQWKHGIWWWREPGNSKRCITYRYVHPDVRLFKNDATFVVLNVASRSVCGPASIIFHTLKRSQALYIHHLFVRIISFIFTCRSKRTPWKNSVRFKKCCVGSQLSNWTHPLWCLLGRRMWAKALLCAQFLLEHQRYELFFVLYGWVLVIEVSD